MSFGFWGLRALGGVLHTGLDGGHNSGLAFLAESKLTVGHVSVLATRVSLNLDFSGGFRSLGPSRSNVFFVLSFISYLDLSFLTIWRTLYIGRDRGQDRGRGTEDRGQGTKDKDRRQGTEQDRT